MEVEGVAMPETAERAQLPIPKIAPATATEDAAAVHRLMVHFHTRQVLDTRQDVVKLLVPFLSFGKVRSKAGRSAVRMVMSVERSWGRKDVAQGQ